MSHPFSPNLQTSFPPNHKSYGVDIFRAYSPPPLAHVSVFSQACWRRVCYHWGLPRLVINRPSVTGAVLQTPPLMINSLIGPFPPNFQKNHDSQTVIKVRDVQVGIEWMVKCIYICMYVCMQCVPLRIS